MLIFGPSLGHVGNFGSFSGHFGQFCVVLGYFGSFLGHFLVLICWLEKLVGANFLRFCISDRISEKNSESTKGLKSNDNSFF